MFVNRDSKAGAASKLPSVPAVEIFLPLSTTSQRALFRRRAGCKCFGKRIICHSVQGSLWCWGVGIDPKTLGDPSVQKLNAVEVDAVC